MRGLVWIAAALALGCKSRTAEPTTAPAGDAAVIVAGHDAAAAPVIERWAGRIVQPPEVPLEFEVQLRPGDPATAQIAIPAQGLALTDLVDVTFTAEAMSFTLAMPGATDAARARFTVTREPGATTARGRLDQHGAQLRVFMKRLADDETVGAGPSRPQTPRPPFPYDGREASFRSKDGTTLAGTLTVPRGAGKHPAVVMVTGTGAQDRDETLFGHKPFLVIADHLTRAGIAVLRVDDRGVGGSGGDTASTDLADKTDDALAGVAWLASQPDVDPERIGIIGHSEGGLIAPMDAVRQPGAVAFLVLLAGPGMTGTEILLSQLEAMARAQGARAEVIAARLVGQQKLVEAAVAGADEAALRTAVNAHVDELLALATPAERAELTDAARRNMVESGVAGLVSKASRAFIASDAPRVLAQVECPVLALNGSLDLQVLAEPNLAGIARALADNPAAETRLLPGLNHLFQPAKLGTVEEYATIDVTVDPAVLELIAAWIAARTGVR